MGKRLGIPFLIINTTFVIISLIYLTSTDYKKSIYQLYEFLEVYIKFSIIPSIISIALAKNLPHCKYSKINFNINFSYIVSV